MESTHTTASVNQNLQVRTARSQYTGVIITQVLRMFTPILWSRLSHRSALHGRCWRVPADAQRLPKWRHLPQHLRQLPVRVCERLDRGRLQWEHRWLCQCCVPPGIHLPWPRSFVLLRMPPWAHRYSQVYLNLQEIVLYEICCSLFCLSSGHKMALTKWDFISGCEG